MRKVTAAILRPRSSAMGFATRLTATTKKCLLGGKAGDTLVKFRRPIFLSLAAVIAIAPVALSGAKEFDYIELFGGSWSGSGTVLKDAVPWHVSCHATGRSAPNRLTVEGRCNVSLISVRIAADIRYDPASNRYSGTYIGAKVGPAHVSGKRSGNVVNLVITWPKPVHGDTQARMEIINSGSGDLRITISDNVEPGGPERETSDLALTQS